MTKNDPQLQNKTNTQDDSREQSLADATWETLSGDDSFTDNLRQALDQDLPERDETLKDRLSEQLLSESDSMVESKVTLGESKLQSGNGSSSNRSWTRWIAPTLVAAACVCLGSFLTIGYMVNTASQNVKQISVENRERVEELLENKARIVEASKSLDKQLQTDNIAETRDSLPESDKIVRRLRIQQLESALQESKKKIKEQDALLSDGRVKTATAFNVVKEAENRIKEQDGLAIDTQVTLSSLGLRPETLTLDSKVLNQVGPLFKMGENGDGKLNLNSNGQLYGMAADSSGKGFVLHNGLSPEDAGRNLQWNTFYQLGAATGPGVPLDFGESDEELSRERYNPIVENPFVRAYGPAAISTFSIDVDTASYSNMRRFLNSGKLPPRNSVRIEELVNYFDYDYPQPKGDDPFSVDMEVAPCPWSPGRMLLRVGLQGKDIHRDERPTSNLVFLVDVSGSMQSNDKLPLLKRGLQLMVNQLSENDRVSIVTYAGNAGIVLEPTHGDQKKVINEAIERLTSGGSTHGSAGIEKAYDLAVKNRIEGGTNRVIWATDGDLNVGITDDETLINLVAERAKEGIFLTTLGFGTGNLQDGKLEQIANKGNGIYAYIDSFKEAQKVLVQQMSASLVTIAKDVKLQIEFNPTQVTNYRLIGYENRMLATEDFDNDAVDAGEIGAGHRVTAIYELQMSVDPKFVQPKTKLKYQSDQSPISKEASVPETALSGELLTLALRYKQPESSESKRIEFVLKDTEARQSFDEASDDFRFAASVASFGMMLRQSKFRGETSPAWVEKTAAGSLGEDHNGYRAEFIDLVRKATSSR